jgi:hypothetical protein
VRTICGTESDTEAMLRLDGIDLGQSVQESRKRVEVDSRGILTIILALTLLVEERAKGL